MGPESRMLLQQVLQSPVGHVRMRGLHLLMSAAAQRPGNVQALRSSGEQSRPSMHPCLIGDGVTGWLVAARSCQHCSSSWF